MGMARILVGFIAAATVGFLSSVAFLTGMTLSRYPGFEQALDAYAATYALNLSGLATGSPFVGIFAVALAIGFAVAAILKRLLTPLAGIAYVLAGAAAAPALFLIVENVMIGGGVGAFFGARGIAGLALQALAGAASGLVFTLIAVRKRG